MKDGKVVMQQIEEIEGIKSSGFLAVSGLVV